MNTITASCFDSIDMCNYNGDERVSAIKNAEKKAKKEQEGKRAEQTQTRTVPTTMSAECEHTKCIRCGGKNLQKVTTVYGYRGAYDEMDSYTCKSCGYKGFGVDDGVLCEFDKEIVQINLEGIEGMCVCMQMNLKSRNEELVLDAAEAIIDMADRIVKRVQKNSTDNN